MRGSALLLNNSRPRAWDRISPTPQCDIAFIEQFYKLNLGLVDSTKKEIVSLIFYLPLLTQKVLQMDRTGLLLERLFLNLALQWNLSISHSLSVTPPCGPAVVVTAIAGISNDDHCRL